MLRGLLGLLIAANALFFAWTQGWLDSVLGAPRPDREPQRLAAQVRPELVKILPTLGATSAASAPAAGTSASAGPDATPAPAAPASASAASAASAPVQIDTGPVGAAATAKPAASAPATPPVNVAAGASGAAPALRASAAPTAASAALAAAAPASNGALVCLEAGPYTPEEVANAEGALRPLLAAGAWTQRRLLSGGEWMIYMGPYPDQDALDRKKAELARIRGGVPQDVLTSPPALARGIALGRFPSPTAANAVLAQYRQRGIRTARVLQSSSGAPVVYLRVAQADVATAERLSALKTGRSFTACPR